MIIDLNEWDINYTEFAEWITNVDADVYAVSYTGGNEIGTKYLFEREEDFTAFKLTFQPRQKIIVGFKGKTSIDAAYYFCPYTPLLK